ncbi:MAG TPA: ABC transporter ATP-binding protein [Thermoanaerobacterales bacterium]|nr:ABC transporter ATP-binding protein [Thermoanaerobacterales bacterium]
MPLSLIVLKDIKHTYKLGNINVDVLKGISLSIERGEFVSIMGPSGSGKSTLLNIIGCLDKPSGGSYEIDSKHVEKLNDNQLADIRNQFLGFVFQSFHLLPELDAISNVELPLIYRGISTSERRKKAKKALEDVGLGERLHHRPTQMSGGEQQRVAIARAFVGEPSVILADEPTGALDSRSGQNIMGIFQKLNTDHGITIVQVTHEEEIANHGTRVFHLRDGKIEREVVNEKPVSALFEEV